MGNSRRCEHVWQNAYMTADGNVNAYKNIQCGLPKNHHGKHQNGLATWSSASADTPNATTKPNLSDISITTPKQEMNDQSTSLLEIGLPSVTSPSVAALNIEAYKKLLIDVQRTLIQLEEVKRTLESAEFFLRYRLKRV